MPNKTAIPCLKTRLRLKESYEYATKYYKLLQHKIFIEGQTPWPVILSNFNYYWDDAKENFQDKYALDEWLLSLNKDTSMADLSDDETLREIEKDNLIDDYDDVK